MFYRHYYKYVVRENRGNGQTQLIVLLHMFILFLFSLPSCVASNQVLGVPASANKSVDITVCELHGFLTFASFNSNLNLVVQGLLLGFFCFFFL